MINLFIRTRAFSMIEVIVAAVIFVAAAAGVFAALNFNTYSANESSPRYQAALFAKALIEGLNNEVEATGWDTQELAVGNHPPLPGTFTDPDFTGCNATYVVTADASGARRVDLTATCP